MSHRLRGPTTAVSSIPSTFRPELHGLRGLAIGLVVVFHVFGQGRVSGGIDAFLAISGFLMTLSLTRQIESRTLTIGGYLARLARRLLPGAAVVLCAVAVAGYLWLPSGQTAQLLRELRATVLYAENWELISSQLDYAAAGPQTSPLQHFWSLSVQGQFYLLWFVLLVGASWLGRRIGAALHTSALVAVATATVASIGFHQLWAAADQQVAYFHTGSRIWELGLGGVVALLLPALQPRRGARVVLGWVGIVLLVSCGFLLEGAALFPGPWALWPVAGVVLVLVAGTTDHPLAADRLLRLAPFRFLADVSYAWYLWHWPLLIFVLVLTGQPRADLFTATLVVSSSLVLAWLTTKAVEVPVGKVFSGRTVATLVAAGALVGVGAGSATAVLGNVEAQRRAQLLEASQPSADHPGAAVLDPGWEGELPDAPVLPDLAVVQDDLPDLYTDEQDCVNTHRDVPESAGPRLCYFGPEDAEHTIMVLGGSHVGQWMPALDLIAQRQGWRIVFSEKGGCQFLDRPTPGSADPGQAASCYDYNENLWPIIDEVSPDYLFTIGTTSRTKDGESTPEGFVRYWQRLDAMGIPVLAMRDTTRLAEEVPVCLERTGMDSRACGQERTWRLAAESPLESAPQVPDNVLPMDVTDYICDPDWCPAIQGNVIVYRDTSHITATYMRTLAPFVADELRRVAPELF